MNNAKLWQGEVVTEAIGLGIDNQTALGLPLQSLVGVAFRENPKRAHLLVSKVLGKHYPQSPTLIKSASYILAYKLYEHVGGEIEFGHHKPDYLSSALNGILSGKHTEDDDYEKSAFREAFGLMDLGKWVKNVVVFGYAETATALGASFADAINADYYINSTRYPDDDSQEYGGFEEEHSHATSHHLTPRDVSYLNDSSKVLALVDDELTTGNTMMNTIKMMQLKAKRSTYYIVTLVDLRDKAARAAMDSFAAENEIKIEVFALYSGVVDVPADALAKAQPFINEIKQSTPEKSHRERNGVVFTKHYKLAAPHPKNGLTSFDELNKVASGISAELASLVHGKTLVLGIEEDMYLALQVAYDLEATHAVDVDYSTSTRSPVLAYDNEGYAIRDRIKYVVPEVEGDTDKRFAYNIGSDYDSVVIISGDSEETAKLTIPNGLINALKARTRNIFIMESVIDPTKLQKPLTSPEFGSYKPEDVQWLLKDLSNVKLEGATADRERSVQSGESHYAESLPIEYQPSDEYQQLFLDQLQDSKNDLALSVAIMAEQIYRRRDANPVLVSLARAGTPVGVLTRRYLKKAYNVDVDHFAVSIVRDRGIDYNALNYLASNYDPSRIIWVDGWSGKGRIGFELTAALEEYEKNTGIHFSRELALVADPAYSTDLYGTREDVFISSSALNSTVSGLVSRTVLNETYIGKNDYHGAKFYSELAERDYSNHFIDTIDELFTDELVEQVSRFVDSHVPLAPDFRGWAAIERIAEQYGIDNIDRIKPGGPETLRILLRRVPERILIRPDKYDELKHIVMLAKERGAPIELVEDLPYAVIGLIKKVSD